VATALEPGRLRVSSSPFLPPGAGCQVIALADRGLGVDDVEEVRDGDAGSKAEDVCDKVFGLGRLWWTTTGPSS